MAEFKDYNHLLIQLFSYVVFALLFACAPVDMDKDMEKDNESSVVNQDNQEEIVVPEGTVDLGIVLTREDGTTYRLYWATSNLCEDGLCPNPEDYGDYFAWGETEPHYATGHSLDNPCNNWRTIEGKAMTGYDWASYKWGDGKYNNIKFSRYCPEDKAHYWDGTGTPDNKTEFSDYNYADDAAPIHHMSGCL